MTQPETYPQLLITEIDEGNCSRASCDEAATFQIGAQKSKARYVLFPLRLGKQCIKILERKHAKDPQETPNYLLNEDNLMRLGGELFRGLPKTRGYRLLGVVAE